MSQTARAKSPNLAIKNKAIKPFTKPEVFLPMLSANQRRPARSKLARAAAAIKLRLGLTLLFFFALAARHGFALEQLIKARKGA